MNNIFFKTGLAILSIICISACTSLEKRQLETALEFAGDNRAELEKVIIYYREQGDKEKEEAAVFSSLLVDSMLTARIDRIRYIIRNDDNGIRKGNHYELLTYEQIPEGTLYWLRNYTRGKEECIFTYEDGKQVWW